MKCRCSDKFVSRMPDSSCVVCGEGDKAICYECKQEEFHTFGICAGCGASHAENDCVGYFLCDICIIDFDDFWSEDEEEEDGSKK